jgi:hypothetical protein
MDFFTISNERLDQMKGLIKRTAWSKRWLGPPIGYFAIIGSAWLALGQWLR